MESRGRGCRSLTGSRDGGTGVGVLGAGSGALSVAVVFIGCHTRVTLEGVDWTDKIRRRHLKYEDVTRSHPPLHIRMDSQEMRKWSSVIAGHCDELQYESYLGHVNKRDVPLRPNYTF